MKRAILYIILAAIFSSCASTANLTYYTDAQNLFEVPATQSYDLKIQKDDIIAIKITSETPELVIPFTTGSTAPTVITSTTTPTAESQATANTYLVNSAGEINFPILGIIKVEGMTHNQAAKIIQDKIVDGGYIKDADVSVELTNFKVTVLGEVSSPGVYTSQSERVSIFDAVGMAGDLTIYGVRDNVSIVREQGGKREVIRIDLSNKDILASPYYYLKPNDIVYVEPNKKQKRQSNYNSYIMTGIISGLSILFSILTLTQVY